MLCDVSLMLSENQKAGFTDAVIRYPQLLEGLDLRNTGTTVVVKGMSLTLLFRRFSQSVEHDLPFCFAGKSLKDVPSALETLGFYLKLKDDD